MLSLTYEITTALSHTDELISPPYDIAIVTISYERVTKSPVWDTMMSKKNMGWPFYAAVEHKMATSVLFLHSTTIDRCCRRKAFKDMLKWYAATHAFYVSGTVMRPWKCYWWMCDVPIILNSICMNYISSFPLKFSTSHASLDNLYHILYVGLYVMMNKTYYRYIFVVLVTFP